MRSTRLCSAPVPDARDDSRIVVHGRRAVVEALRSRAVEVEEVRVARGATAPLRREVAALCTQRGVRHSVGGVAAVRALSREPRHDQGVAARVHLCNLRNLESFVEERRGPAAREPTRLLALDGVTNSQNAGMIARSAAASALDALLWPRAGTPWLNGLVVKAAAAAVFEIPIVRCETTAEGLAALRAAGHSVIGLCTDEGRDLFATRAPHRAVYVVGSETDGLSDAVRTLLDEHVRIPISPRVESLNAAVSAALLCFHVARPVRGSG